MSQILEYFKSLFTTNNNHSRKRRRNDFNLEEREREPFPKYKKVTNEFPTTYTRNLLDDDSDLFYKVKQSKQHYEELLEDYYMDQRKKHYKAVLDDGEFSDEEEQPQRMPSSHFVKSKVPGFNYQVFYQNSQPSTSSSANAFGSKRKTQLFATNGTAKNDDEKEAQFASFQRKANPSVPMMLLTQKPRQEMPSLIPISRDLKSSLLISNGHSSSEFSNSMKPFSVGSQPSRGRRSILDFSKKNRAFDSPKFDASNSIIFRNHSLSVKNQYDDLIKSLIPRYSTAAIEKDISQNNSKPIDTIDLSDDSENIPRNSNLATQSSYRNINNNANVNTSTGRKSDFLFKKPTLQYVELSDDEADQTQFSRSPGLSSTQIIKTKDIERTNSVDKSKKIQAYEFPPVNSLREKQSTRKSLEEDHIKNIIEKFHQKREEKKRTIQAEEKNASKLEEDRIQHERIQQRRIDDSITTALSEKCIILDEEEEVIDEFVPLNDQQNRMVHYALHGGSKNETIISKFNMNLTRHDFATLDGLNWLNDEVINFYMELIKERSELFDHLPKVHAMNTFFIGKLLQSGHSGVRRWTRKVDIFSFDIIPIPVHVGGVHWCMVIIHLKNKSIRYYDSMGHPNVGVLEALKQYLKEESMDKRKIPFDISGWTFECVRDCPQQKNGSDCGVFSCQFAEFVSRESSISFEQQHMQYFRRKMIYEIASGKMILGA